MGAGESQDRREALFAFLNFSKHGDGHSYPQGFHLLHCMQICNLSFQPSLEFSGVSINKRAYQIRAVVQQLYYSLE